jgi:serine/threonine-protein kinase
MGIVKSEELPFERLGDYEVLAPILEGGMASVWLGRSTSLPERFVALKVIRPEHGRNKEFVAMFVDESRIASRLTHPNIVSIVGVGYDGKRHFLAMEVLRGHTLLALWKALHAQGRRLSYEVVAWMGARVADALHYAHELVDEKGAAEHLVHRDVNPANIFITREGVPKLIDFGLAKARDRIASTAIGVVKGKLAYLAPEQAHGQTADRRSDVFALGVTLWEMSLDRRLFLDDTDVATIRKVREMAVPDPTTLDKQFPRALANALSRALERSPDDRWQTAAALRDALDGFLASTGASKPTDAAAVRALVAGAFGNEPIREWERVLDEANAEKEKTRLYEGREAAGPPQAPALPPPVPAPRFARSPLARVRLADLRVQLPAIATACGVLGAVAVGLTVRGCRRSDRVGELEQRVVRIEDMLGIEDAGATSGGGASTDAVSRETSAAAAAAADRSAPCAIAKVASYLAWQEAVVKAKSSASGAEGACASLWGESKRQGCYWAATSNIRATQGARDTAIAGGAAARDAVKSVKDDPKNEAIGRARSASDTAFAACEEDGGS